MTTDIETRIRKRHPGKILDIRYTDLTADPLGCVERIYTHAGIVLADAQRSDLVAHLQDNTKGKHGSHRYDLSEFGLTASAIKLRFADYERQFLS